MTTNDILPDVLIPNLKLVICGSAVSTQSSQAGSYYAGQGNKFWKILHETGLTDRLLLTSQYCELLHYQIGLTDVAKKAAGVDAQIQQDDYDAAAFTAKMENFRPRVICFNGKKGGGCFPSLAIRPGRHDKRNRLWNFTTADLTLQPDPFCRAFHFSRRRGLLERRTLASINASG